MMKTALQIATERAISLDIIPPITDEMGIYWSQPDRNRITLIGDYAIMSHADFKLLPDYSSTVPNGVYAGKMWRRYDGAYDKEFLRKGGTPEWLLMWYTMHPKDPAECTINSRKIAVIL